MANIVLDFLHNYQTGERRETEPANAYQYDEGHVLEAVLPEVITACEIHYWIRGMEEADAYTPTSITPNSDNSCTVLGNIPNSYFETNGELRIYIVVTDGTASITTYEGKLHIAQRAMPDDYVDDDPENEATRILTEAQAAATTATQQAQAASNSAGQAQQSAQTLSQSVEQITTNKNDISTLKDDYTTIIDSAYVTDTASDSIASFTDGANGVPVKSLKVNIEPVQAGTGDPSPTNIRPISGRTQAAVTRTGVNVWDEEWEVGILDADTGEPVTDNNNIRSKNYIPVIPNTDYYITCLNGGSVIIFGYDQNKTKVKRLRYNTFNAVFTTSDDRIRFIKITTIAGPSGYYGNVYNHDISINYPSTDHDYHEGHVQTVTIDLGQTVYGGTLDVSTGVLTVDRQIVDLGTLTWVAESAGQNYTYRATPTGIKIPSTFEDRIAGLLSDIYKLAADVVIANMHDNCMMRINGFVVIRNSVYSTADAFKTAMSGHQLVYELAEPFEVALTAQEVRTLLGTNNVFADCGDTTVEYRADTKLYINKVLNA